MSVEPWRRIEPTNLHHIGWRTIVTKNFILPDGNVHNFETMSAEGIHFAGVIALTKDNQVVVAYQYRPGPEKMMYEVPGGGVEEHETDHLKAALRELQEETGYVSDDVVHLGDVYKDAYNNATWHYYLARNCELHVDGQQLDEHEYVEVKIISIAEFLQNAKTGKMTDVEAAFLAYDQLTALL